jgi:endo-1,4-beta-xylanase
MRREFLTGAATLAACSPIPPGAARVVSREGLADHARQSGRYFGAAVKSRLLREDRAYRAAAARECNILVQEYELKRKTAEPKPGKYDFKGADEIIDFAQQHGMRARGHTLVWYTANPTWLEPAVERAGKAEQRRLMTSYIDVAMRRYAGRISEWDVVNETLEPNQGRADGMRAENLWMKAMGEHYIDLAFHPIGLQVPLNSDSIDRHAAPEKSMATLRCSSATMDWSMIPRGANGGGRRC